MVATEGIFGTLQFVFSLKNKDFIFYYFLDFILYLPMSWYFGGIFMKKKSGKLSTLERNRTSIMTDNLKKCMLCENNAVNKHEIFFGRNRQNSMKYGLVMPLCYRCHLMMHRNAVWQEIWHVKGQEAFEKCYPDLNFLEIFKKSYK